MNEKESFEQLVGLLCSITDKEEMRWFLERLLTNAEVDDLTSRLRIYAALATSKYTQREVAKLLGVSISKVTRGASNMHSDYTKEFFRKRFPE